MLKEIKIKTLLLLVYTPDGMNTTVKSDCVIFAAGRYTGTQSYRILYEQGPGRFLKDGTLKPSIPFICLLQPSGQWTNAIMVDWVIDYALANLPVEKFSLTGLSAGAGAIFQEMANGKHWQKVKSIVAFSMDMDPKSTLWKPEQYASVKFWALSGNTDSRTVNLMKFAEELKKRGYTAKSTIYPGGHSGWNTYYNPKWEDTDGFTVYEWLGAVGAAPVFKNAAISKSFTRNNCLTGYKGSSVVYEVPAGKYSASTQAEADQLAASDLESNGQAYANANGACTKIPIGSVLLKPVTTGGGVYITDLTSLGIKPGTNVILRGEYASISIGLRAGFAGEAELPVLLINEGRVVIKEYFRMYNAVHYRLTGTGGNDKYGIVCKTLAISNGTSDYEIDHVNAGGGGSAFWFKISQDINDPKTLHPNWVIKNVKVHDNYVHDTKKEGMYIGHTDPSGAQYSNGVAPVQMQNVKIFRNKVERTGWDGIQLANAREGAEIYENVITDFGLELAGGQQNGIVLGGNTTGSVTKNTIVSADQGGKGGLAIFGYGDVTVADNILENPHRSTNTGDNIYINDVKISNNPDVPPVNINPPLRVNLKRNIIKGSTALVAIRNANYNKTATAGVIEGNTIETHTTRTASQLIVSGAGDTINDNKIINV